MGKFIKNTILNYITANFEPEINIKPERISDFNSKSVKYGNIVYLCEREIRAKDNFALKFAQQKSKELNLPLKIIHPKINFEYQPKNNFIERQIFQAQKQFENMGYDFEISEKFPSEIISDYDIALLITDFNPILNRKYLKNADFKIFEIDGHNIIPAKFVSDRQEYNAATMRRKIYGNIFNFLTESDNQTNFKTEADKVLEDFIKNRLQNYAELKNNPSENVTSGLSKYLNLGFISAQRAVLEVIKSDVSDENKEVFLEELIIRKELADNFCRYCSHFKDFSGIPLWARNSLEFHKNDIRAYLYSAEEFENCKTHDKLWNMTQRQLKTEGVIHGYLRMYWAKKIAEWTKSPDEALKIAIYLNDKYAFDSPSPNGYTGILWAIGGLHDRAFADYPVTGKIRRMTYSSIIRKFDLTGYFENNT